MKKLIPINASVLVELSKSPYGDIPVPDKKYDSRTEGKVIAISDTLQEKNRLANALPAPHNQSWDHLIGKTVYWEEYKDGIRAEDGDKTYAFIKFEDIRGYEAD